MYYEINVSHNGVHHFATAPRSIKSEGKAISLAKEFEAQWPLRKGYNIAITKWIETGTQIYDNEVTNEK